MNKLFKGEIYKLFHSPIMYFLMGFFIFALTIFPSIFTPAERVNRLNDVELDTTSVVACYKSFCSAKQIYDEKNTNLEDSIQSLIDNNNNFKEVLVNLMENLSIDRRKFSSAVQSNKPNGTDGYISLKNSMINDIIAIENQYENYSKNFFTPVILADESLDYKLTSELTALKRKLESISGGEWDTYKGLDKDLSQNAYLPNILKFINQLDYLDYSQENLKNILQNFKTINNEYTTSLSNQIDSINNEAKTNAELNSSKSNRDKINELALHYLYSELNNIEVTQNNVLLEVTKNKDTDYLTKMVGYQNYNRYKIQENATKCDFLLKNNLTDFDISDNLSFNNMSSFGEKANAFDYAYFSIELISILIICFTVIIGASMIAKEYSDGTIKLLCVKPYNRHKILSAKIMATMFISFIFILVATIVSFIVGYFLYGISFPATLIIFNSTTVFSIPIWLAFLIYICCIMLKVYIYTILAVMISVLFKSHIASICVSCGIYIINIATTFASAGANWIKYNIFANIDLFKYFGGSFTNNTTNIELSKIFYSPVFNGTNFYISLTIVVCLIVVFNAISYLTFKKRDIL